MKLEVIPAMFVQPGDTVVGEYKRKLTRSVQPMANGMTVQSVSEVREDRNHSIWFNWAHDLSSAWHSSFDMILVVTDGSLTFEDRRTASSVGGPDRHVTTASRQN